MEYSLEQDNQYSFETPTARLIPPVNALQKEMAAYASLLSSDTPEQTYTKIIGEIENVGRSNYVDSVLGVLRADENTQRQQAVVSILQDPEVPKEDKFKALQYYEQNKDVLPSLREKYVSTVAAQNKNAPIDENAFARGFFEKERAIALQQEELLRTAGNWDDNGWKTAGGFLSEVAPFYGTLLKGRQFTEALYELEGTGKDKPFLKKAWDVFANGVLQGSASKEIRDGIAALPTPEQRVAKVKAILQRVGEIPGVDYNEWSFMMQALEGDQANWETYLYNGLGLLGAAFGASTLLTVAGRTTTTGVKGIIVSPKSVAGTTAAHNPEAAGKMLGSALLDETGRISDALGTTNGHIVGSMLPKVSEEITSAIGPEFNQFVKNILEPLDEEGKATLNLTAKAGILYTDEAKSELDSIITNVIKSTESAAVHLGKSTTEFTEFGVKGQAVFGKTSDAPFSTYDEALLAAKELAGKLPEDAVAIVKTDANGKITPITPLHQVGEGVGEGEYYLKYTYNKELRPEDVILFGPDAVSIRFDLFGRQNQLLSDVFTKIAKSGKIGSYLFAHHMLPEKAAAAGLSSFDKALRVEDRYLGFARKYIAAQPAHQRKLIAQFLDEGEKYADGPQIGKVFTFDEIVEKSIARGLSTKEAERVAEGYFVYRRLSDWVYTMLDREKSAQFARDGFKWFNTESGRFVGRELSEAEALKDIKMALNTLSDSVEDLNAKQIQMLYADGGKLIRLGNELRRGDGVVQYAKVSRSAGQEEITQGALPYVRGWVPRFYENNYFVTRTPKSVIVNGVRVTDPQALKNYRTTHYAADSLSGAERRKLDLQKADDSGTYDVKQDRFDVKTALTIADTARIGFVNANRRGIEMVPGGTLTDPLEGLMKVIQSASRTTAMSEFLAASKSDFIRQYGDLLVNPGQFPRSLEDLALPKGATREEVDKFKNATAVYRWLEGMMIIQRYDSAVWKNIMYGAGEFAEKYSDWLARGLRGLGEHYPVDVLKKLATTLFISMRPARQILLQPSQLMMLSSIDTSLLNPINVNRFANTIGSLNLAHLYYRPGGTIVEKKAIELVAPKMAGVSKEDWLKQADQLYSTGLLQSVDMNTLIDGLYAQHGKKLITTTVEEIGAELKGITKAATFNYGRAIGFDRGEQWNLIGSWLVARKRFQKMFPDVDIYSRRATEQIAADTREIAFSMSRPGAFAYQNNAMSLPLQFLAAPHKAILNMTTSKMWSPQEKVRLMASSFILYGSAGVGMLWIMDDLRKKFGSELSTEQWKLLEGGVLDWGVNYTVNALFDEKNEKTNLDLARSFSPGTNLPFTEFLTSLSEKPIQNVIFGPSWNIIDPEKGRLARAVKDLALINKRDPITNDNYEDSLLRLIAVASGGTDWMKYRAMKNLHETVTTNGELIDKKATLAEAYGAIFGIAPSRVRTTYELNKFIDEEDKHIKAMAKDMATTINSVSTFYRDDPDRFTEQVKNMNAFWNFEKDESMHRAFAKEFNTISRQMGGSGEGYLHYNVYSGALSRSQEVNKQIFNYANSLGEEDAANRVVNLIGENE